MIFFEIDLKMILQHEDINDRLYVRTIYEIIDENNNSLYIATINNKDYQYFLNHLTIRENIFL